MLIHILDTEKAKEFFSKHGIKIGNYPSFNRVVLESETTDSILEIWAEVEGGIPGVFIEDSSKGSI